MAAHRHGWRRAIGLQPTSLRVSRLAAAKNIEITPGSSEEDVVKKFGEPLRSVKVGWGTGRAQSAMPHTF